MGLGNANGKLSKAWTEFGGIVTEPIINNKVFEGVTFGATKRFTIPALGVVDLVFDPTAVTTERLVLLPISFKAFGAGPVYIDIYFGADIDDDGTLIECFNRDTVSANTCNSVIRLNPTVNTTGVKLPPEFVIHSDGVPATATLGGDVKDNLLILLRKDGKYLIRLTNQENAAADAWFGFDFFEANRTFPNS